MKKFFKKVSLVLAFALVLGSADHVTVAKAAETWKFQSSAETLYLGSKTAGADTFDFNFAGAPAGYTTNNTFAWVSSDPKVATVAAGGVVTAVANGATTITCRVTNKTTGNLTATATANVTVRTIEHATKVEIYDAQDATKTAITSAKKLTVGETIDLNRKLTNAAGVVDAAGQAKNTASTDKTAFASDNEAVATVDPSTGVVTAVKAGTAVVKAYTYDVTDAKKTPIAEAKVVINVVADATYSVKQTAVDKFTLTFENDVTFSSSKLQVYKIFDGAEFNAYVKEAKQTGKNVDVTLYFDFDDEATEYKVVYDGIERSFVASIGKAVRIIIESTIDKEPDAVYITNQDIAASLQTNISVYPVDINGIDVRSKYTELVYNLETADDMVSISDGTAAGYAASIIVSEDMSEGQSFVVTGSFTVDAENEEVLEFSKVFYAKKPAAQRIITSKGAYIDDKSAANTNKNSGSWNSGTLSIALDDEVTKDQYLHVMLLDNYGKEAFSQNTDNGTISFASANPDKLLVESATGKIKTIATGTAIPVVVYWAAPLTTKTSVPKAYAIVPVTITLKRTVTKVSSSVETPVIASEALVGLTSHETEVTIKLIDNYNAPIAAQAGKVVAYIRDKNAPYNVESPLTFEVKKDQSGNDIVGTYVAKVDGTDFDLGASTAKQYSFVTYVNDKMYSSAAFQIKVANPEAGSTGYLVTASPITVTVNSKLTGDIFNASDITKCATSTIKVFVTQNGVKTKEIPAGQIYPYVTAAQATKIVDDVSSSTISPTAIYFYDVALNGAAVAEKSFVSDGKSADVTFVATATGDSSTLGYVRESLAAGNYTVRLYRYATNTSTMASKLSGTGATCVLSVIDESGTITMTANSNVELKKAANADAIDPVAALKELFSFKYNENTANFQKVDLANVSDTRVKFIPKYKVVGSYIYFESVTVDYVPSTSASGVVIRKKFDINKTYPVMNAQ